MAGMNGNGKNIVTELGRLATTKALELQKTLVFVTVPGYRIGRPRKILQSQMNDTQEAQLLELAALLKDFTYHIIWQVSGTLFDAEEKDDLADYFLTEKLINCLAYYHPPEEFTTYYGQAVKNKMRRFVDQKLKDGTLNAISLDADRDDDSQVINIDTLLLSDTLPRELEESITREMAIEAVLERACDLDEEDRRLLVLRFYHDLLFIEIAQELGLSEQTVRSRYHKIIKVLRKSIMSQPSDNTHTPHTLEN